jgi:uncharacterized membrane protein
LIEEEFTYKEENYEDRKKIAVSTTRLIVEEKADKGIIENIYPIANIASIQFAIVPPDRLLSIILFITGLVALIGGIVAKFGFDVSNSISYGVLIAALVFLVVAVVLFILAKYQCAVIIGCAPEKENILFSKRRERAQAIVEAINKAIVLRG